MNNANKHSLQRAESLDDLATRICGFGYYANHNDDREHPIPKVARGGLHPNIGALGRSAGGGEV